MDRLVAEAVEEAEGHVKAGFEAIKMNIGLGLPARDHLAKEPIVQRQGVVKVPTGPGLGIEIDCAVIDKHRVA
jgi:L-alanine-DL-glutamate epimerase-like enolase superfamily enzyme